MWRLAELLYCNICYVDIWDILETAIVYFHGHWHLSVWDKLFTAAPVKSGCDTVDLLVASWKVILSKLEWQGRPKHRVFSLVQNTERDEQAVRDRSSLCGRTMGRPPANGGPVFRFLPNEVATMEKTLEDFQGNAPTKEAMQGLADAFSISAERAGKTTVQYKQVWNWFQNRRHAVKKSSKMTEKPMVVVPQTSVEVSVPKRAPTIAAVPSVGKAIEPPKMEFEAKSSRDKAWYDVESFSGHRMVESSDPLQEVRVRFAGFGPEEDEWVNVRTGVRQRSLPCEAAECVAVLPGDLILCFQEGSEQALYFDARIKEVERRRHDVRGCRCRFLVEYDHDKVVEIVPLRKVCRRPETEYRLQGKSVSDVSSAPDLPAAFGAAPIPMALEDKALIVDSTTSQQVVTN
ncbi:hypothetical protein GOP47_0009424 [Adiantum capillus-veneris]|uniref:Homeobox domain-containing protein n=1 Tax=Adiantum capillus-veneris TaxID=13818 RepID=A0A9D4UXH1_ADICA|nr:hypothetical protein GOP47_0009424 [Adiantum capillus-veneris]